VSALRFRSAIIDVDSTLCGIEGIDWLATRRGAGMAAEIARVTERAMSGELALEAVYGERLALIRPTREEIRELSDAYAASLAPDAAEVIARLRGDGLRIVLVSGGIRQAIEPVARALGFASDELTAVSLRFGDRGEYAGYDEKSPLTRQIGKPEIVRALALPRPSIAVGDGATDAAMRAETDAFAAYVEFARREHVVKAADFVVGSFRELEQLIGAAP